MRAREFVVGPISRFGDGVAVAVGSGIAVGVGVGGTEVGVGMGSLMVGGGEIGGTLPSSGRALSSGASFWSAYMLPGSIGRSESGAFAGTELSPSLEHATINVINARTPRRNTVRHCGRQSGLTKVT